MIKTFTLKALALGSLWLASSNADAQTFINPVPIPPLLDAGQDTIKLEMRQFYTHQFNPNDPSDTVLNGKSNQTGIETWGYNSMGDSTMTILGPTLLWHTGEETNIQVYNHLSQPTTTHWHGAEVPAYLDGGPHQPIVQGDRWDVYFTNLDSTSTIWYHPHYHDNTYPQVQMGLSGLIVSQQNVDPIQATLPRTYGVDDIPLVLGDISFTKDTIDYNTNEWIYIIDTTKSKKPIGIVNGVANPYIEVPAHMVRLRILNGSTRKGIQYGISDSYTGNSMNDFVLVGGDGGYLIEPDTMSTNLMGPGARNEILLDLTNYIPGDVVYLRNMKELMPGYIVGSPHPSAGPNPNGGQDSTAGNAFLQIRIVPDPPGYTPVDVVAPFTTSWDPGLQDTLGVARHRTKEFIKVPGVGFTINGTTYNMVTIDDTVCVGDKEIWTLDNQTTVSHPFHIHKIFFRVLDIDSLGTSIDPKSLGWNGPKDDILVGPNWKVRFLAKFDDYPNAIDHTLSYMYHCHILTHEDSEGGGMMKQFVVTDEGPCSNSIDEMAEGEFRLYPNPTDGEVYIQGFSNKESFVQVIDIRGNIVKEQALRSFSNFASINIDGLSSGIYIVKWTTNKASGSEKLIIK